MIEFGGIIYTIDLDAYSEAIKLKELPSGSDGGAHRQKQTITKDDIEVKTILTETFEKETVNVDSTKYEIVRMLLEIVMDGDEDSDDTLGADRAIAKLGLSFLIAFNTLIKYGILVEHDEEE